MGGGDALERESEEEGRGKLSSEMEIYRRIYCADLSSPRPPPPAHGQLLSKQAAWYGVGGGGEDSPT